MKQGIKALISKSIDASPDKLLRFMSRSIEQTMKKRHPEAEASACANPPVVSDESLAQELAERLKKSMNSTPCYDVFQKEGFHLLRDHYYSPIPNDQEVSGGYWQKISDLPGVEMDTPQAFSLVENQLAPYMEEFRSLFPVHSTGDGRLHLINGSYMAVDGHMYYSLIRHLKPKRIIEIGGGNSTRMAVKACLKNKENGQETDYTVIEPFPAEDLRRGIEGLNRLREEKLQDVPLEFLTSLEPNDILFIDSSHVLRSGNDVQYEYLEILPRLSAGVYVHIHDISLPKDYPVAYYQQQLFWNEQYLLQAFLAFNHKFKVVWPGNYLMVHHPEKMYELFPEIEDMRKEYPLSEPSAFWIRS